MSKPWLVLIVAGLFETAWAVSMKSTQGWTRLGPSALTVVLMIISFVLLARAMRDLPAGTAYAVWTGIGTVGVALVAALALREPMTPFKFGCIALIVLGIVGLRLTDSVAKPSPTASANP